MFQLALIGLVGGLITGISPCILPVLPVIFFSGGVQSAGGDDTPEPAAGAPPGAAGGKLPSAVDTLPDTRKEQAEKAKAASAGRWRPYLVILGLVLSFSIFTLLGSFILAVLHLPQDLLRWVGLVVLVLIGLGLIFERFQHILELPFSWIPQRKVSNQKGGFVLGLALGAVYVPCAGPVLAAIAVAGATGQIGPETFVLTVTFAVGAALPLLIFALAGRGVAARVKSFRKHQKGIRITGGILMIALAVGLVFNLPQLLQRLVPDYTTPLQQQVQPESQLQQLNLGGLVNDQNKDLSKCSNGAKDLESCGTAPDIKGIQQWFNTANNQPVDLKALKGKVVLIDFWAYSCINCQRSIPHVVDWYNAYKDAGLEVIGIHSPEYAFEKVPGNVMDAANQLGIKYPVAIDNNLDTWTNYRNRYWPAHYLIDASGTVRQIQFGEGDYQGTENLIRQLLQQNNAGVNLPSATEKGDDNTPALNSTTQETYLGVNKKVNFGGSELYTTGDAQFAIPANQAADTFALKGDWNLSGQYITPTGASAQIKLNYHAKNVYIVVAGEGNITVTENGSSKQVKVSGTPTLYPISQKDSLSSGDLTVDLPQGIQAYSFTYG